MSITTSEYTTVHKTDDLINSNPAKIEEPVAIKSTEIDDLKAY